MISCLTCSFKGQPHRESRANEQLISCPRCGTLIKTVDSILPGALDPVPCALCGDPVYSDLQQTLTKESFGKVLCCTCESAIRGRI